MKKFLPYAVIALLAFAAYGPILWNGAGFSNPDDVSVSQVPCCSFRPFLVLTYQFNARHGGWMLTNLGLHVLASWLLLAIAGPWAAAFFAVHPMAADAVASVGGRSALLVAIAALASVWMFKKSKILAVGTFLALAGGSMFMDFGGFRAGIFKGLTQGQHFLYYLSTLAVYAIPHMFFPVGMTADPAVPYHPIIAIIFAGLALAAFLIGLARKEWRAGLWLLLLPLVPYAVIPLRDPFLDHRGYLCLAGASIIIAKLLEFRPRLTAGILAAFIVLSLLRAHVYSSPINLYEDVVAKQPSWHSRINLAANYAREDRWYEAEYQLEIVTRETPQVAIAWTDLAMLRYLRHSAAEGNATLAEGDAYQRAHFQNVQ